MSDSLMTQIKRARPQLKLVSPLSHWIMLILGLFNIALGLSFWFAIDSAKITAPLLIVNDVLTYKFWAVLFIGLGIAKLVSLRLNNWELSRKTLLIGVSLKATWAIALVFRVLTSPGTLFVTLMWVTLAAIQIGCYFYFAPRIPTAIEPQRSE